MEWKEALAVANTAVFAAAGRHLNDVESVILQGAWQGQTYEQIARASGYSASYLTRDIGPKLWRLLSEALGESVSKTNFQAALERWQERPERESRGVGEWAGESAQSQPPSHPAPQLLNSSISQTPCIDWGEMPDVSTFWGREQELAQLKQWIVGDASGQGSNQRCRLVLLLGMGGIGKTALAAKLAHDLLVEERRAESRFECGIWRSLRNAPALEDLLQDLVLFLSGGMDTEGTLPRLVHWLRAHRCLLILDNVETILQSGQAAAGYLPPPVGHYRSGYEAYGDFFRVVGETAHQSCLVLTSREKMITLVPLEGAIAPVRSLQLTGSRPLALALLAAQGIRGTAEQRHRLCDRYSHNPLALKIVASTIQDLFNGDLAPFLEQETVVFNGIRLLLDQQYARLSPLETAIMYWLAINREWTAIAELANDLTPPVARSQLLESLEYLRWRGLIECRSGSYTQQPVVMEYITDRLIERLVTELREATLDYFLRFALLKTTVKDSLRISQERMIVRPIAEQLMLTFSSQAALEQQLLRIVLALRRNETRLSSYGTGNLINLCHYLPFDLSGFDLSGLTIRQADLHHLNLQNTHFAQANFIHSAFTEAFGAICSVAFSPHQEQIAAGDGSGGLRWWQLTDGKLRLALQESTGWVLSIQFSPDGQTLVSGSSDCKVQLWEVASGALVRSFEGHTSPVWCVRFNPQGTLLASGGQDCVVNVWDVRTGERLHTLPGHDNQVQSLDFGPICTTAPDSEPVCLFTSGLDQTVKVWDVATGELLRVIELPGFSALSLRVSPDGRHLATGNNDYTVCLWDAATGDCLRTLRGHHHWVMSVRFSPRGDKLASAGADGVIKIWHPLTGQLLQTLKGHTSWVWSVDFSASGDRLLSGSNDHSLKLWDIQTGQSLKTWQGYSNWIMSVQFSPEDSHLVSGGSDYAVRLWDAASGTLQQTFWEHDNWVLAIAFHPRGTQFASSSSDCTIKLWDVETQTVTQTLTGHQSSVWNVQFSPDGSCLASASLDHTIKLWDVQTGECWQTFDDHTNMTWTSQFSPDGRWLATSSHDCTAKIWDLQAGVCVQTFEHPEPVWEVAFSPDGAFLATGCNDGTVTFWHLPTGERHCTVSDHQAAIQTVRFNAEGTLLASGSDDYTVKLWSWPPAQLLKTLTGHTNRVTSVAFNSDGSLLASASADTTIRLWDTRSGKCLKILRAARPYEGMDITGVTGLGAAQIHSLKELGAVERTRSPVQN